MTVQFLAVGSGAWWAMFGVLLFARGMDMLSTWVGTPHLVLEGNPVAKRLGWRGGALLNIFFSAVCAVWPFPAIMLSTTSILVAARNFQSAWMMRSMGEAEYAAWIHERMAMAPAALFVYSIASQAALTAVVGAAVMSFAPLDSIPFAVGAGIAGYAVMLLVFSLYAFWTVRR